jgi:hypothetical protein
LTGALITAISSTSAQGVLKAAKIPDCVKDMPMLLHRPVIARITESVLLSAG